MIYPVGDITELYCIGVSNVELTVKFGYISPGLGQARRDVAGGAAAQRPDHHGAEERDVDLFDEVDVGGTALRRTVDDHLAARVAAVELDADVVGGGARHRARVERRRHGHLIAGDVGGRRALLHQLGLDGVHQTGLLGGHASVLVLAPFLDPTSWTRLRVNLVWRDQRSSAPTQDRGAPSLQSSHGATCVGQRVPARTTCAASGSQWKLNSAQAVMLPTACALPPMTKRPPSRSANAASMRIAMATLVSGPRATRVTCFGQGSRFFLLFGSIERGSPCAAAQRPVASTR